ncbi:MAG: HYR domain-containing protein [Candidatus Competibacteraceae bacterium]
MVNFKQETTGINFNLSRPGSISGRVYEKDGTTPIVGANVFAFPVNPQLTGSGANSQPDGSYKVQGLVTGEYAVQVTVTGHVSASNPANVAAPNETPNINFSLDTYPYPVRIIGQGVVGQQGGNITVSDTSSPLLNAGVEVPSGALPSNTVINISEVDAPALPPNLIGMGVPVHFGPEGLQFAKPVTIKIPYKQADLDNAGITDPNQLDVYTFNITTQAWILVPGTKTVDTVNRLVMIAVDHFSIFRLAALSKRDTTPPVLNLPADITVEATSPSGAAVTYSASATDDVDGPVPVKCAPASGSTFPIGTTTVSCTATDNAGNQASGSFKVKVVPLSAFSTFSVDRLGIDQRHNTLFLVSKFTLGPTSNGINPVNEPVTLTIANFTTTIPAGAFRKGRNGVYAFAGKINNVAIEALIIPLGNNRFGFQAAAYGANLTGTRNPVTVRLTIGNDQGTTSVNAIIIKK